MLKAVVFDWAGTILDHGSRAPMGAFVEAFARFQVPISIAEARRPMGLPKREHIRALLADGDIAARWRTAHGMLPDVAAIDRIYEVFVPMNAAVVANYAELVPGARAVVEQLRAMGMKIGSTTGYTRSIMEPLLPLAVAQGYAPDNLVCAGDLADGRPGPLMMYQCFVDLGVWPAWHVVKVDDTAPGIGEGVAVGCWTVGVTLSGNGAGLSAAELAAVSEPEKARLRLSAGRDLRRAGAHYLVDSVADLLPVLDEIEGRLARGERPTS